METLSREVAVEVLALATPLSASEEMGHDGKVGRPLEAMTVMRQEEIVAQVRGHISHEDRRRGEIWEPVQARLQVGVTEGDSQGLMWVTRKDMLFIEMGACLREGAQALL